MAPTRYQRLAYRRLGAWGTRSAQDNPHLAIALQKAQIPLRPEMYLSSTFLSMILVGGLSLLPMAAYAVLWATGWVEAGSRLLFILIPLPLLTAATVYLLAILAPDLKARQRARDINARLPYALNYISTMASAGSTPEAIFSSLSKQPAYGGVADEAAWIERDLRLLGYDVVTALNAAIDRSPSSKFQDFLQGVITTLTSGGDLKSYFLSKSEQFLFENRQDQNKFLESLGVLAESFVVVVVAAPLFLIVMLSVLTMFGGDAREMLILGYVLVLLMLPMAQAGFAYTIHYMTPET